MYLKPSLLVWFSPSLHLQLKTGRRPSIRSWSVNSIYPRTWPSTLGTSSKRYSDFFSPIFWIMGLRHFQTHLWYCSCKTGSLSYVFDDFKNFVSLSCWKRAHPNDLVPVKETAATFRWLELGSKIKTVETLLFLLTLVDFYFEFVYFFFNWTSYLEKHCKLCWYFHLFTLKNEEKMNNLAHLS